MGGGVAATPATDCKCSNLSCSQLSTDWCWFTAGAPQAVEDLF